MMHPLSKTRSAWLVSLALVLFFLAVALTLNQVKEPIDFHPKSLNPSPYGYTLSLSLFFIPSLALLLWMIAAKPGGLVRKAFLYTLVNLTALGFLLDLLFASQFFRFENSGATLGILFPTLGGAVPIEEFAFYFLGFLFILLLYIWLDESWLRHYNTDYENSCPQLRRIRGFHWGSVWLGLLLFIAATAYRNLGSDLAPGVPWYFTYLILVAIIPSVGFFQTARAYINWRALFMTGITMLLISLLWEVSLAMPYGWWGFNPDMMIGIFIRAWHGLPLEEVILWVVAVYTTIIVYETIKIWQASGRSLRQLLLGT